MKTYQKRPADALIQRNENVGENPFAGGMPSLVDGATRKDLPEAMRTKMENAFGADFSNLNIIESEKVAEGGARAVTQGNTIAFAPGEFNVYSPTSEALLGHELSHVVSQARGESRGGGLVDNAYLEAKADREGVMAAAGQQVYNGPVTPLSASSPASVSGPMQCKKKEDKDATANENLHPDTNVGDWIKMHGPKRKKETYDDAKRNYKKFLKDNGLKERFWGSGFVNKKMINRAENDAAEMAEDLEEFGPFVKHKPWW